MFFHIIAKMYLYSRLHYKKKESCMLYANRQGEFQEPRTRGTLPCLPSRLVNDVLSVEMNILLGNFFRDNFSAKEGGHAPSSPPEAPPCRKIDHYQGRALLVNGPCHCYDEGNFIITNCLWNVSINHFYGSGVFQQCWSTSFFFGLDISRNNVQELGS